MALSSKVGSFALNASTGNQSITGVGFQPLAIIFICNKQTSDGNSAGLEFCKGMATSSTNRAVIANMEPTGSTATNSQQYSSFAKCLMAINSSLSVIMDADLVSMDSDGFTINLTTTDGVQRIVNYIALGGTDLTNANIVQWTTKTSTGTQGITGMGFQPDCLFDIGSLLSTAPPSGRPKIFDHMGVAVSSTKRGASGWTNGSTGSVAVTERSQLATSFIRASNVSIFYEADLVSMDSDGFTINWTTANGTARYQFVLGLKGGHYSIGSFNQPTSNTTQSISGLGFQPSGLFLMSFNAATTTSVIADSKITNGAASSTTARFSDYAGSVTGGANYSATTDLDRTKIIKMITPPTPTIDAAGDLSSFDSDGFTLNWTTTDATAREIIYLSLGNLNITTSTSTSSSTSTSTTSTSTSITTSTSTSTTSTSSSTSITTSTSTTSTSSSTSTSTSITSTSSSTSTSTTDTTSTSTTDTLTTSTSTSSSTTSTSSSTSTTTTLNEVIVGVSTHIGVGGSGSGEKRKMWKSGDPYMRFSPPGKDLGDTFIRQEVRFMATETKSYTIEKPVRFIAKKR